MLKRYIVYLKSRLQKILTVFFLPSRFWIMTRNVMLPIKSEVKGLRVVVGAQCLIEMQLYSITTIVQVLNYKIDLHIILVCIACILVLLEGSSIETLYWNCALMPKHFNTRFNVQRFYTTSLFTIKYINLYNIVNFTLKTIFS